jgi:hypothetical protein
MLIGPPVSNGAARLRMTCHVRIFLKCFQTSTELRPGRRSAICIFAKGVDDVRAHRQRNLHDYTGRQEGVRDIPECAPSSRKMHVFLEIPRSALKAAPN